MPAPQPVRSLAAIVFTDVVGYSALSHRDDAKALRLVEEHFQMARALAPGFSGRLIKTIGDSVHMEFASAQAATACAIAIQQKQQQRNAKAASSDQFEIRIGVHLGDVEHRGGDVYGDGVNIAARLQPLAPVGGIAISVDVRRQLREEMRDRFVSRGAQDLKNIATPVEMFVIDAPAIAEVAVETPASTTQRRPRASVWRYALIAAAIALVIPIGGLVIAMLPFFKSHGAGDAEDKSIAVLPFADMSQAKDQGYFSDGIAEDVLNLLAKVPQLKVIARTSSFSYKGKDTPIADIAQALQVVSVLQGSVRKAGGQVRIAVQLIRAKDSSQLWSETYDRKVDDIFVIQDEIASAVVSQLRVKLLGEVPMAKPVDPRVYPLILQADAVLAQQSKESRAGAVALYQQALEIAPNEARAWAGLARGYFNQTLSNGERSPVEGVRQVKEAANKALAIDPDNVLATAVLGRVSMDLELDLPAAAQHFERALALEPSDLGAINSAAVLLMYVGRMDQAIELFQYRVAHDPASATAYCNLGIASYNAKQWDAAINALRTTIGLSPEYAGAHQSLAGALLLGRHDASAALKEFEAEPDEAARLAGLPVALQALGRVNEADAALRALIDKYGKEQAEAIATVYAYRGQVDAAFEWLDKAVVIHDPALTSVLTEPLLESLHGDPRWLPLLRKIGYAPEQLAKIEFKVTLPQAKAG